MGQQGPLCTCTGGGRSAEAMAASMAGEGGSAGLAMAAAAVGSESKAGPDQQLEDGQHCVISNCVLGS